MSDFITTLKDKERELRGELELTPIFKKWESVRSTISLFEEGQMGDINVTKPLVLTNPRNGRKIPTEYNTDLTWRERVLFIVNELDKPSIVEIIAKFRSYGASETDAFLEKRISTMASALKREGYLDATYSGKKAFYFIKAEVNEK